MIELTCRAIGCHHDETLRRDAASLAAEVAESISPAIVSAVTGMVDQLRTGALLERYNGHMNPIAFSYNVLNDTSGRAQKDMEDAMSIYEDVLCPLVGDRAEAIWWTCFHCVWADQNQLDWDDSQGAFFSSTTRGYLEEAEKNRILANYWARRMGFDSTSREMSRNMAIKHLCFYQSRLWTVQNGVDGGLYMNEKSLRQTAFDTANWEAHERLDVNVVRVIKRMVGKARRSVHREQNPTSTRSASQAWREAEAVRDSELRPLLGDRAAAVWEVALHACWHEQNMLLYHVAEKEGHLAAAEEHRQVAVRDKTSMDIAAYRMDLDE